MTYDKYGDFDTDREVSGIVYEASKIFDNTKEGKTQAQIEAYFVRNTGYFARAMKVLGGTHEGHWACYKSRVKKGF